MQKDIENIIDSILATSARAMIETQTILQLLATKNIVTREEVQEMRKKVEANSEHGKILNLALAQIAINSDKKDHIIDNFMRCKLVAPHLMSEQDNELLANMLQMDYARKDKLNFQDNLLKAITGSEPITKKVQEELLQTIDNVLREPDKYDVDPEYIKSIRYAIITNTKIIDEEEKDE